MQMCVSGDRNEDTLRMYPKEGGYSVLYTFSVLCKFVLTIYMYYYLLFFETNRHYLEAEISGPLSFSTLAFLGILVKALWFERLATHQKNK